MSYDNSDIFPFPLPLINVQPAEAEVGLVGLVHSVGNHTNNEEFSLFIKPLMNLCGSRNTFTEGEFLLKLVLSEFH